jgi:hypothetical protein
VTVPTTASIAKWRHVVRVLVRMVGVPLVVVGAAWFILCVMRAVLAQMMQPGALLLGVYQSLVPLLMIVTGYVLLRSDRWLARVIVPDPTKGCPNCGYWVGSRRIEKCPECGLVLPEARRGYES